MIEVAPSKYLGQVAKFLKGYDPLGFDRQTGTYAHMNVGDRPVQLVTGSLRVIFPQSEPGLVLVAMRNGYHPKQIDGFVSDARSAVMDHFGEDTPLSFRKMVTDLNGDIETIVSPPVEDVEDLPARDLDEQKLLDCRDRVALEEIKAKKLGRFAAPNGHYTTFVAPADLSVAGSLETAVELVSSANDRMLRMLLYEIGDEARVKKAEQITGNSLIPESRRDGDSPDKKRNNKKGYYFTEIPPRKTEFGNVDLPTYVLGLLNSGELRGWTDVTRKVNDTFGLELTSKTLTTAYHSGWKDKLGGPQKPFSALNRHKREQKIVEKELLPPESPPPRKESIRYAKIPKRETEFGHLSVPVYVVELLTVRRCRSWPEVASRVNETFEMSIEPCHLAEAYNHTWKKSIGGPKTPFARRGINKSCKKRLVKT